MSEPRLFQFGPFELDAASGELRRGGDRISLPPQPAKVLELLVRRAGEVVTRDEIRTHVWCDDVVVDFEQGLNFCIRRIREVLGDHADAPRYIDTLPRRGYRFIAPVTVVAPAAPKRVTRLIVLPFRMLRPDPETEFLSFGLPEAVSSALGGLRSLVVRSTMTAARFSGDSVDPQRIGMEANVDVIVTGTLLCADKEIRVATQLTDASSGTLLWSHTAQVPMDNVFRVQDDLTQRLVDSLALPLTSGEQTSLRRDVPKSAQAYNYFLRGNQLSYDAKQWETARGFYEKSVEMDPGYAPAWARLGRIHHVMGKYLPAGTIVGLVKAEEAFRRSLALNPDLALTHKLYAQLEVDLGRAHDAMVRLIEHARSADPELLAGLVTACRYVGLLDASNAAHLRAVQLDPKVRTSVPHTWFLQRDYERAAGAKVTDYPYIVALSFAELGKGDVILPSLRDIEARNPTRLRDFAAAARTLLEGDKAESLATIRRVVDSGFGDPEALFYLTRHLAHLGEMDGALQLFQRVVAGGFYCYPTMEKDPWLDPLRKKPEFTKLLKQAKSQHESARTAFEELHGGEVLGEVRVS